MPFAPSHCHLPGPGTCSLFFSRIYRFGVSKETMDLSTLPASEAPSQNPNTSPIRDEPLTSLQYFVLWVAHQQR